MTYQTRGSVTPEWVWARVDKSGDCWLWTSEIGRKGYGRLVDPQGRRLLAHRVVYELVVGPIPDGLTLDHLCRVHACVNPEHLEPVTTRENVLRGQGVAAINAAKTHCSHGHEFTPENTRVGSDRERICRQCSNDARRERHRRARLRQESA